MPNWAYQTLVCKNHEDYMKIKNAYMDENEVLSFDKIIPMPKSIKFTKSPMETCAILWFLNPKNEKMTDDELIQKVNDFAKKLNTNTKNFDAYLLTEFDYETNNLVKSPITERLKDLEKARENLEKQHSPKEFVSTDKNFIEYCKETNQKITPENYGKQVLENILLYACTDWYDWAINSWGTKWDLENTYWDDDTNSIEYETAWDIAEPIAIEISKQLQIPLFVYWSEEQFTQYGGIMEIHNGEVTMDVMYDEDSEEMFIVATRQQDPNQENYRYDKEEEETISLWSLEDEDPDRADELFNEIPEIDLAIPELEEFLKN